MLRRRGPLTMGVGPVALFARTRPELASPDVKFTLSPFSADNPAKGLHDFSGFTLIGYQLRPDSRGELKLRSADPRDTPAMFPNYLSAENDRRTIVDSLKLCREFLATDHLRRFISRSICPARTCNPMRTCLSTRARLAGQHSIKPAPAAWAPTRWRG